MIRRFTPQRLRRLVGGSIYRLNLAYAPRTPLDPELRRSLTREFEPGITALSALLNRDLSTWLAT